MARPGIRPSVPTSGTADHGADVCIPGPCLPAPADVRHLFRSAQALPGVHGSHCIGLAGGQLPLIHPER